MPATIVLDRDRFYGSALARVISRRQAPDDITLIVDPDVLRSLLEQDPDALVVVDEAALEPSERLHELMESQPAARFVVMVSSVRPTVVTLLRDGAGAIVHRASAMQTLAPAVAGVLNGMCVIPPSIVDLLLRHYQFSEQAEANEQLLARLSPREQEIIEHLVAGRDPSRIATELDLSVHTVRSHLKRIFRKLEVHSTVEAVLTAVGAGVVPVEHDDVGDEATHRR